MGVLGDRVPLAARATAVLALLNILLGLSRMKFLSVAQVTMERLLKLEHIIGIKVRELMSFIDR
ncbi:hypothetical protein QT970_20405 [Microcoleus sp. herbarium8]